MRNLLSLILVILGVTTEFAQPIGYKPVGNATEFNVKFSEEGKKIMSIKSSFVQEKNLSLLEEKIISEGKFWYKKDRKVRLEYIRPFRYIMMMNGEQMVIRDEQKESRISTHSNKLLQQINRIMVDCVSGSILNNKDFTSEVFQNEREYLLIMTPTTKTMKDFFQNIWVMVDKKDWTVLGITLIELGGDSTILKFSNKAINEKLDDSLFMP